MTRLSMMLLGKVPVNLIACFNPGILILGNLQWKKSPAGFTFALVFEEADGGGGE